MMIVTVYMFMTLIMIKLLKNKLNTLLTLEMMMLIMIFTSVKIMDSENFSVYFMFLLSIFMVIDSVYGMSILISNTRNSSFINFKTKI